MGGARHDGGHADAEDRACAGRRHYRMGAVTDGGDAARAALSPGQRAGASAGAGQRRPARQAVRHPDDAGSKSNWAPDDVQPGNRQQLPGHSRLRRALDRSGRRLLEGAGHPRCRPDGRPRDLAHLEPASRQLAASRRHHREPGDGFAEAHGGGGGRAEQGRRAVQADGAEVRRHSPSRRPAISSSKAASSRTAIPNTSSPHVAAKRKPVRICKAAGLDPAASCPERSAFATV